MNAPPPHHPPPAQAWTDADLAHNPHEDAHKPEKVRAMFASIAHAYDLNNRLHSFGRDQSWRRAAVRMAAVKPTDTVLDVACGTGDLTRAFADAGAASVTGLDFTPQMLDIARTKRLHPKADAARTNISYQQGDATALDFPDDSFDIVSIAFGLRNVSDPARALAEFRRVLKPGGRVVVLEFSDPRPAPVAWLNNIYCRHIMPFTATLIARDKSGAYKYLPRSIETFLTREQLAAALRAANFSDVRTKPLTFGVCVCCVGTVQ
ncbi:MAG: bifunctional demethylmenaquinone methyltransferase/2-methoxy-6-polyprenyl-1,4-benzoquinol methylase UbiE [Phycisphaerales bacterium]|nr:bifunctional demethylmenaquinone methyltransferase/2-methoxy-6-polyprenyl-1,4-benzoquinol methylase UbiE [Phycisphaerales bacterium]